MAIIWADFPSGQQGLYGSTAANMLNGLWAAADANSGISDARLEEDPDPNVTGRTLRMNVGTIVPSLMRFVLPAGATSTVGMGFRLWMDQLPFGTWGTWRAPLWTFHDASNTTIVAMTVLPNGAIQAARTTAGGTVLGTTALPSFLLPELRHLVTPSWRQWLCC